MCFWKASMKRAPSLEEWWRAGALHFGQTGYLLEDVQSVNNLPDDEVGFVQQWRWTQGDCKACAICIGCSSDFLNFDEPPLVGYNLVSDIPEEESYGSEVNLRCQAAHLKPILPPTQKHSDQVHLLLMYYCANS